MGNMGRSLLLIYYYYASYTLDYIYIHVVIILSTVVLKTYFLAVFKSSNKFFKIVVIVCFCLFLAMAILDLADRAFLSRPITGL